MKIEPLNGLKTEVYSVLLVEDSDLDFDRLDDLFESTSIYLAPPNAGIVPRNFRVKRATSVDEAKSILNSSPEPFDVLLVSYSSIKDGGNDAIASLVDRAGNAPALLLTVLSDDDDDIRDCLKRGAFDYFPKPQVFYEGHDFLINAILKAIALKQGVIETEELKRKSIVEETYLKARKQLLRTSRITRLFIILGVSFVIFVADPALLEGEFRFRVGEESRRQLAFGAASLIWLGGVVASDDDAEKKSKFKWFRKGSG